MKKWLLNIAPILVILFTINIISIPFLTHAVASNDTSWISGLVPCGNESGADEAAKSCDFKALVTLGQRLINFLMFAAVLMTVVLLVITGFRYVTAGANTGELARAKSTFRTIGIGFLLVLGAWLIINTLVTLLLNPNSGITNPLRSNGSVN